MLRDNALAALYERLGLSAEARAVIEMIRASPPARRVRGAAGNVVARYPSRKMGVTIQAESHRNELAGLYEYEHDPATLEVYDQPPPITLAYTTGDGRAVRVRHTPDYFLLRADAVGWEEWKTEAELGRLAVTMPHRYVQAEDGRWRCPPGEHYAGLAYAFVKGRWVRCISEHHAHFAGRSEREILLASAELRRRHQRHGQRLPITACKLADFLASLEAEEVLLEQRLRDAELDDVMRLGAGSLDADAAPPNPALAGRTPEPAPGDDLTTDLDDDEASLVVYEEY